MSQLSNQPYPKDSDSGLKSGPTPVNGIGQQNNQYPQNGIQSPHLAGTPSSQSSRDPSRETSRDPSPTQYLRSSGFQSQYRPEWRPQMPPINGKQSQDPNYNSFPRISKFPEATSLSPQPPQNLPAPGATSLPTGTTIRPPINSQSAGSPFNEATAAIAKHKQKLEPSETCSNSGFSDLNQDSSSEAKKVQNSLPDPQVSNQSPIISSQNLQPSLQSQAGIRNQSPSQMGVPNLVQNAPNQINAPIQTNLLAQSSPINQSQSSLQKPPNVTNYKPTGLDSLNNSPNQNPYPSQGPWTTRNQFESNKSLNSTPGIFSHNTIPKTETSSKYFAGNQYGISTAAQKIPSVSTVQNVPNMQNVSNLQNIPNMQKVSHVQYAPNMPNVPNMQNVSNMQNMPNIQNVHNVQNIPNMQNVSNMQNIPNMQSIANIPNVPNVQNIPNMQSVPGVKTIPNVQNIPNMQSVAGVKPIPNLPNVPNMQRIPNMQNVPIAQNPQNVQNAQPNVYGGSMPVQGPFLQQNLTSQTTKYPVNYSYGSQLTNTNLSGPSLMGQTTNLQTQATQQMRQMPGMPPLPTTQQQNPYDTRPPYARQMSNVPLDNMNKRYPSAYPDQLNQINNQISGMGITQAGFNKLWGNESIDLLQCRNILPPEKVEPPKIKLNQEFLDQVNCSPDIFRCTLTKIPESNSLLQKSRLPLGVLIHPFKDLYHLAVIQCSTIVRCRACRTYINPFVYFVDAKRWKCNLCYRVNELPDEFQFDPATKSYGDPSRRPEVKTSTIEFIAPSEYMLRPPQPAVYLFVLDVSRLAVESGYLSVVCKIIEEELSKMPGDGRMQVGFIAVDSSIHFFSLPDGVSQPHEMIMLDVEDVFLPCPENLIVNLKERSDLVDILLKQLPTKFQGTHDTQSALGAGLQAAYKLMAPTGGRITVFQTCLPNLGPGALQSREDPSTRNSKDVPNLNPVTDFYKRLALDCSSQQIAIDLFLLNCQYSDLATLSGMCKFSGGCIYHLPLFRISKAQCVESLDRILRRYLTRKIGFEAVMRIRCSRGLSIHTFHGNFFVRSTDLLSLPNVNPDAGFGMQVSIDENLSDVQNICLQAALLYTSSKGERRIRVHTLCLPVTNSVTDILHSADTQCIIGLLSKMAVDRSLQTSLSDARDALINAAIDVLSAYKLSQSSVTSGLMAPDNLKLLPLYIIALLKCVAFRSGMNTRLDDRVFAMCQLKTLPLSQLMQTIYPDLYAVHALDDKRAKDIEGRVCPQPQRLHLSAEKLDSRGIFLMDSADKILIYVGKNISPILCSNLFGVQDFSAIPDEMYDLPEFSTAESEKLCNFVFSLQEEKPYYASLQIIREDSHFRSLFTEKLVEDRFESALSYYEFLQHLKPQVK